MKRTAVSLFVWCAICAWAGAGHAKKAEPSSRQRKRRRQRRLTTKPAAAPAAEKADAPAGGREGRRADREPRRRSHQERRRSTRTPRPPSRPRSRPASWQDIVVVPRKPFLKGGRASSSRRSSGISINDNLDPPLRVRRRHQLLPVRRLLDRRPGPVLRQGVHRPGGADRSAVQPDPDAEPLPLRRRVQPRLRAGLREVRAGQQDDHALGDLRVGRRRLDALRGHPAQPERPRVEQRPSDRERRARARASSCSTG